MKRIGVATENEALYDKIRLALRDIADVTLLKQGDGGAGLDAVITDTDTREPSPYTTLSVAERGADIDKRFRHEDLIAKIRGATSRTGDALSIDSAEKCAYVDGERIRLTDVEYRLLDALMSAPTEFVSRRELLLSVWDSDTDEGVVNVYVHYLRHKLEGNGKKIILSSRKEGYGISTKYRRTEL